MSPWTQVTQPADICHMHVVPGGVNAWGSLGMEESGRV